MSVRIDVIVGDFKETVEVQDGDMLVINGREICVVKPKPRGNIEAAGISETDKDESVDRVSDGGDTDTRDVPD